MENRLQTVAATASGWRDRDGGTDNRGNPMKRGLFVFCSSRGAANRTNLRCDRQPVRADGWETAEPFAPISHCARRAPTHQLKDIRGGRRTRSGGDLMIS